MHNQASEFCEFCVLFFFFCVQEQLDGSGIELPSLYKLIESQVPDSCSTEAWKKRAHWVGSQVTSEVNESVRDAEQYLHSCRPVRRSDLFLSVIFLFLFSVYIYLYYTSLFFFFPIRKHGRLLEEGAGGFLAEKLAIKNCDESTENPENSWSSFNAIIQSHKRLEDNSFGSSNWAAVYLASTPQQAASLGLKFPGVDEVYFLFNKFI